MSSEASTDAAAPGRLDAPPLKTGPSDGTSEALQPWQLFTLAGLLGATIVVFVSRGHTPAGVILLSLIIFAAAAIGVAAWRTFGPLAFRDEPETTQLLAGRTRAALEREKTLALRSIKELEFDFAMGKVSAADFGEMKARLRARASRLLRQLDSATGYRGEIEKEIERRVGAPAPAAVVGRCAACGTGNDADARFCKSCGQGLS